MKRLAGQAGRTVGWIIHHTGMILMTIFLLLALAVGGFAYRLSLGPLQIPWLASRLANIVSGQGLNIHITRAALAWGGYKSGASVPLFLQLGDISARNATGVEIAEIPRATLVFLPGALLGSQAPILVSSTDALFGGSSVPVSLNASFRLSGFFQFSAAQLFITLGSGTLGTGGFPIASGTAQLDITPTDIALTNGRIRLAHVGGSAPVIGMSGTGHEDGSWHGNVTITADSVQANDLAAYWPASLVPQTRNWVLGNITTGTASLAKFSLGISAPRSLATVSLDTANGAFLGNNLDVGWIPHAQPITAVSGTFTLTDKDNIDIAADTGNLGGILIAAAHMHIAGLTAKDQIGTLTIPVTGRVQDALLLINAPPLNLLKDVPPQLLKATGNLTGTIGVTLPLKGDVKLQQVDLLVQTALHDVAAPVPVGNLGFSAGDLMLQATTERLDLKGTAQLAGEPASITASAKFEAQGPDVSFAVQTIAGNGLLQPFGLNADPGENDGITGVVPISLVVKQSPAGQGSATLQADLTKAAVGAPAVGWTKPAGIPGHVNIAATMTNGAISGITTLDATAPDLDITGASDAADPNRLNLTRLHIHGTEAAGSVISPSKPGAPWRVNLTGPSLNITAILNPPPQPKANAKPAPPPKPAKPGSTGPLWAADLHFATFVMAEHGAPALRNLAFTGTGQGYFVTTAAGLATGDDGTPIHLTITHAPQAEAVHLDTADGGYLLRALGAYGDLKGGALVLDAKYQPADGSTGVLSVQNFRLLQAPGFAKVLQGLTVYGIPEATSGPGLVFDHLVAPFAIANNVLTLTGARAFSASLGFTASGTVGLVDGETNLDTTIIPAYALNAALGKIPLIGGLFSAEKGGGLFAVRAHITGQLTDPNISINPLSALTPGFLRDLFGVGENHDRPAGN